MDVEITIISARSIIAADANGKSDPYVKFQTSSTKECHNPGHDAQFGAAT